MMSEQVTLLLEGISSTADWKRLSCTKRIVSVPNYAMMHAALDTGPGDLGIEISTVVFDRSVTPPQFLAFLSEIGPAFRGDVLSVNEDGTAFLSAITTSDGRILYRLTRDDIEFYLDARYRSRLVH
jgi:hypothetical protein